MSTELKIADRAISTDHEPYIICELSANHNGSLDRALKMIEAAAATGADAIKIQTYSADTLTIDCDRDEFRIKGGIWDGYTLYRLYQEAYTPYEWHEKLFAHARELGITIFSTPFDETAVDLLEELEDDRGLRGKISEIASYLGSPSVWQILAGFLLALFQAVTVLSELVTLEVAPMHLVFRFLIALQVTMIGFVFYRFLRLWSVFREFLHQLGHHPLAQSLERLPHKFIRSLGALFLEDLPELTRRQAAQEHFRLLINHMNQLDFDRDLLPLTTVTDIEKVKSLLQDLRELVPHIERETMQQGAATDVPEAQVVHASRILTQILKRFWRARPLPGSLVGGRPGEAQLSVRPGPEQNTAEVYQRLLPDTLHLWLRLAEDFLAIQVVTYINRLFPHLRNGLLNVTIGFVLLLLALIVYPFQPQRYLVLLSTVLLVMTVPTTMYVLAQMNRDEVLSRIAKSQPGKLTWDRAFISQIVIYGVLPLLSLIATQFPEVRGAAFSWLETALKTLK